jgi:16S rRNA (guanine527-N7)-methyltransferase
MSYELNSSLRRLRPVSASLRGQYSVLWYNPEMENFKELAKEYAGIELNNKQIEQFKTLADFLLETNKAINLTAIRDIDGVYLKHFIDSLTLSHAIPKNAKSVIDIGSGAGFPGLPLAIARPDIEVTMVESIGKKVVFIEKCIELLELKNTRVVNERAEKLSHQTKFEGRFDVATARAVTALPKLIKLCVPFIHKNGIMIAMKSENKEELEMADTVLVADSLKIEKIVPINVPNLNPRQLIVISRGSSN